MEEKSTKKGFTPAEKPTYEQLEQQVESLKSMSNQLIAQIQQLNIGNLFKRLDYLFKVVENNKVFTPEFTKKCVEEIENYLTVPETSRETAE